MLRGFARAPMDSSEHNLGILHGPSRRNGQRRLDMGASQLSLQATTNALSSFGRAILSFCLVLLLLGVLPATFVFWTCIIVIVFAFLRLRLQAQHPHEGFEQAEYDGRGAAAIHRFVGASPGVPVVRVIPGGGLLLLHTDPHAALQQLNLQLRYLDEEMGLAGYGFEPPPFLRQGHGGDVRIPGLRPPPVSEADIAALPCHAYKPPRGAATAPAAGSASPPAAGEAGSQLASGGADCHDSHSRCPKAASQQPSAVAASAGSGAGQQSVGQGRYGGGCQRSGEGNDAVAVGAGSVADTAAAAAQCLTCPVCLDAVVEGSRVMTLPCLHQFHADCITPWLRQQGVFATCPMCKTPVFR